MGENRKVVWLRRACTLGAVVWLVLWGLGRSRYTSVGWDTERVEGSQIRQDYYRVRWPANGDVWVGGGGRTRSVAGRPAVGFDPASTFLEKRRRTPHPLTPWNHLGWWLIANPERDPSDGPRASPLVWGWWVGVPGWLPALLLGTWPAWRGLGLVLRRLPRSRRLAVSGPRNPGEPA